MRLTLLTTACILLSISVANAAIAPEAVTTTTMAEPQPSWFIAINCYEPAYIFGLDRRENNGAIPKLLKEQSAYRA